MQEGLAARVRDAASLECRHIYQCPPEPREVAQTGRFPAEHAGRVPAEQAEEVLAGQAEEVLAEEAG
jgi:hypothetical protein